MSLEIRAVWVSYESQYELHNVNVRYMNFKDVSTA